MAHKMLATLLNCRNRSFHTAVVGVAEVCVEEEDNSEAEARLSANMDSVSGGTRFCRTSWATVSRVTHRNCKVVVVALVLNRTPTPTRPRRAERRIHLGAAAHAVTVSMLHTVTTTAIATASQGFAMFSDLCVFESRLELFERYPVVDPPFANQNGFNYNLKKQ
jgi:hypothetical protein